MSHPTPGSPSAPGRLDPEPVPRRDVLGLAGLWSAGIAIGASLVGMARLPRPRVLPEPSGKTRIGPPGEFPPGTVVVLTASSVRIVSRPEGIAALSLICTHLGCVLQEEEGGLACPCHGSKFSMDGKIVAGPAPRGLRWLEVSQAIDGSLLVDTQKEVPPGTWYGV